MSAHADLAPSAAARWMICTASVKYCKGYKGDDDRWNVEGKAAHDALELWLDIGVPPTDGILYTELEYAYEYAIGLENEGYTVSFEQRLQYDDDIWGTVDILGTRGRHLAIADYKHGYRPVEAKHNAQMATYGICVTEELGKSFNEVALTVIQPRIPHIEGVVRTWNTDGAFLEWHRREVEAAKKEILGDDPKFVAGKHCKFCPREGDCKVYTNWVATLVMGTPLFNYMAHVTDRIERKIEVEDLL